ncbi:protein NDRG3-like [Oppia nitens]|uniref:protein NDRG3-like n=1 Tax=Oppia nitens TaxID=1686743 RepID=UPI0023DC0772|nr:protein NDRG3-like [Oppia nitens]
MDLSSIELTNVESSAPLMRSLSKSESLFTEERVDTEFGQLCVAQQGADPSLQKPIILTYHDLGLNSVSNFQAFFNYIDIKLLLQSFCVYHLNAPGMEESAPPLPDNYVYPTLDQMAQQVHTVCKYYNIKSFIGFGVGAGANILCRYALTNPDKVDGLFLINPTSTASGWTEWLYQKVNIYYLGSFSPPSAAADTNGSQFPSWTQNYLMWHHFGKLTEDRNRDLVETYRKYFTGKSMNARNLSLFTDSYIKRTDLNITRGGDKNDQFKCSVLVLCGCLSPHVDDTVTMNSRLDPANSTWMKLSDCAMVLEEQPAKVSEAFRLFLQGLGYALTAYERRRSSLRKMSTSSGDAINGNNNPVINGFQLNGDDTSSRKNSIDEEVGNDDDGNDGKPIHIVENPIVEASC